ncbi:anthrone oxygenase family protein [Streptomyces sp. NPDC007971]|uniref:anthrone oxygenase family protein n=1 Tax=Streptomyces sp. NPDC007971 TaxID=3364799 RepID=UPI0036EF54B8
MSTVLAPLALLTNGIAAGIMTATVIGIVPLMLTLPYERYVQTVHFLWPRFDPVMPLTNGLTVLLDLLLALTAGDGLAQAGFATAAGLLLCVMGISITKNVPVNRYVKSLSPAVQPPDWAATDPRRRWQAWNTTRTSIALLAFVTNIVATVRLG